MREGGEVLGCWVIGVVVAEDQATTLAVMVAVFDHGKSWLDDDEFFEIGL